MTFEDYQKQALTTVLSTGDDFKDLLHWVLGLNGEAGEVAEKLKKIIRDKGGVVSDDDKIELAKELGDVLWYIAVFAEQLGVPLDIIAQQNLDKLASRKDRGMLGGSGDNR
ncbi:MAG: nucleoside triphosphate pyrophosphohydrolase family protein [Candidatus Saccharimonadales bacterium]